MGTQTMARVTARDWRRMALTALGATALVMSPLLGAAAQTPAKNSKAAAQATDANGGQETGEAKAATKKKKQDPLEAQRAIDAALKLVEAGKSEAAMQALTATLAGGNLPPAIMAKALLYRGIAYRQQQKPAQAIADLTSALWLKGGLSETDRTDALRQRASAYQEAGLSASGQATVPAVPGAVRPKTQTSSSVFSWGAADTAPAPVPAHTASLAPEPAATSAPQSESGGWNLFGNLFGGGSSTPSSAPPVKTTTAASAPSPAQTAEERPAAKGWSSNTQVRSAPSQIETSAMAARPEGRFRVQLAIVRSQDEAQAVVAKVKREHAGVLAGGEPLIDQAVIGNMGSFYRVRVGPFATQYEGQAVCAKLKGSGVDCLLVTQ
jgi:SPOR domain